jgi:hypothetical protein
MASRKKQATSSVVTLTFGDVAENSHNMEKLGSMASEGFSVADLEEARVLFESKGATVELFDLEALLPLEESERPEASLLVVKGWLGCVGLEEDLLTEQRALSPDTKCFMRGQVKNRIARHNLCFDEEGHDADYSVGKGTVISFSSLPHLSSLRESLPTLLGSKARGLKCEGNYYYDSRKCHIGWHGDAERRKVVGVRLGPYDSEGRVVEEGYFPLHYKWYKDSEPISGALQVNLGHGDLYVMSEYAVGTNWLKKKVPTLRHSAGSKWSE